MAAHAFISPADVVLPSDMIMVFRQVTFSHSSRCRPRAAATSASHLLYIWPAASPLTLVAESKDAGQVCVAAFESKRLLDIIFAFLNIDNSSAFFSHIAISDLFAQQSATQFGNAVCNADASLRLQTSIKSTINSL